MPELIALLEQIQSLAGVGDRARFVADDHYRWVIERLWIAVGNEAEAYLRLASPGSQEPWRCDGYATNSLTFGWPTSTGMTFGE